jgi:hypothetical protein
MSCFSSSLERKLERKNLYSDSVPDRLEVRFSTCMLQSIRVKITRVDFDIDQDLHHEGCATAN